MCAYMFSVNFAVCSVLQKVAHGNAEATSLTVAVLEETGGDDVIFVFLGAVLLHHVFGFLLRQVAKPGRQTACVHIHVGVIKHVVTS